MRLLREGLLDRRVVVLAGGVREAVSATLSELGADVLSNGNDASEIDALVYDAQGAFGDGGEEGLRLALERAWEAIRAVAVERLIPAGRPGKVVLIGPRPAAGGFADAARAGLENLARTLSVEWARYGLTVTMIAPGLQTTDRELADVVAYLVSEAGDYVTGCRIELGSVLHRS